MHCVSVNDQSAGGSNMDPLGSVMEVASYIVVSKPSVAAGGWLYNLYNTRPGISNGMPSYAGVSWDVVTTTHIIITTIIMIMIMIMTITLIITLIIIIIIIKTLHWN